MANSTSLKYILLFFRPFYRIEQIIITPTHQETFEYPVEVNRETINVTWSPVFDQDFLLAVSTKNILPLFYCKFEIKFKLHFS